MKKYNTIAHAMMIALFTACMLLNGHSIQKERDSIDEGLSRVLEIEIDTFDVELIKTYEMRFCYISFVRINGQKFIVKQKKSDCFRKIMGVIRDAITAHIAEDFGIAHRVAIIPAGKEFPGKPRTDWPATLHTIAPGKMVKGQDSRYNHMNIKQDCVGFRPDMLHWMVKHPVLVMIVALDTFLCNHDRHRGNLFYKAKTDSFCAIDMDSSFKYNLCALACKNFTKMIFDRKLRLTSKEINVLIEYKEYLEFLIDKHPSEDTLELYTLFLEQAGIVEGSPLYTEKIALEIENNKRIIKKSYRDVQRLIPILEELIEISRRRLK